jgi:hypothetical protein
MLSELDVDESLTGRWSDPEDPTQLGYFDTIKYRLKRWNQRNGHECVVDIVPLPMSCLQATDFYLVPTYEDFFPVGEFQLSALGDQCRRLAGLISSVLDSLQYKETMFAIGNTSQFIAEKIVHLSGANARRYSENQAAVILVDRTLDLAMPCLYSENLMDLLYDRYPRRSTHSFQLSMPVSSILTNENYDIPITHQMDKETIELVDQVFSRPFRDAMVLIRDYWSRLLRMDYDGKDTLEHLSELRARVKDNKELLYQYEPLLVHFVGWMEANEHVLSVREELFGIQKVLIATLMETLDISYAVYQISDLLGRIVKEKQSNGTSTLTTRDVLLLTLFLYSLTGTDFHILPEQEQFLQEGFVNAMMASNPKANIKAVKAWVGKVFTQLGNVARHRVGLDTFQYCFADVGPYSTHTTLKVTYPWWNE